MKIVILMARSEESFSEYPLYMTEVNDQMILEQQIKFCLKLDPEQIIFCVKKSDIRSFHVDQVIKQIHPEAVIVPVYGETSGSVCTAMLASEYFDFNEEVLFLSIDDLIEDDGSKIINNFRTKKFEAGVVSFRSVHPRYSFAKLDVDGNVLEVVEKQPISKDALASFYYFKNGNDFIDSAKMVIEKDNKVKNTFYISQTLNEHILKQKTVGSYQIANSKFHPLKSKNQLAKYIQNFKDVQGSK